ncbi:MAG: hypothetical protein ACI4NA_04015, partial [Succinivibrio sp.]
MNKRLLVVLKADPQIGTGHLMRVKGLLPPLMDAGLQPCLAADSLDGSLLPLCGEYREIVRFKAGDSADLEAKARALSPSLALFDHYFLGSSFEAPLGAFAKVAVIDDLQRRHEC